MLAVGKEKRMQLTVCKEGKEQATWKQMKEALEFGRRY
jgi:hypothetical protein